MWNRAFGTCSFTRNGQHLGIAARDVPAEGLSAMIGMSQPGIVVHAKWVVVLEKGVLKVHCVCCG